MNAIIIVIVLITLIVLKQCECYNKLNLFNNIKRKNAYELYSTSSMFASLDKNNDGHLSISEIVSAVPDEVKKALVTLKLKNLFLPSTESVKTISNVIKDLRNVVTIPDFLIMSIIVLSHKLVLKGLYTLTYRQKDGIYRKDYKQSFWGSIEKPVTLSAWFFPVIYLIDMFTIVLHGFGYDFHVKGDLPRLICTVATTILCGMYFTKIKDWAVGRFLRKIHMMSTTRDVIREATVDELTSLVIWGILGGFCLEAMSLELGFALGSIFAVGGLGSASLVLALRSTIENVIGGILIKVQDKFRINEVITIPKSVEKGIVENINYAETRMRLPDDSTVLVPNHTFTKMEIINWSRTPYRLFKTSIVISLAELNQLPKLVNDIKDHLRSVNGVEVSERDLLVSAGGFKEGKIIIDVEAHLRASTELEASKVKTYVVNEISNVLRNAGIK